jgi:hypothetical protein
MNYGLPSQVVQLHATHLKTNDKATLSFVYCPRQARRLLRNLVAKSAAFIHHPGDDSAA